MQCLVIQPLKLVGAEMLHTFRSRDCLKLLIGPVGPRLEIVSSYGWQNSLRHRS
jgi:hypothetical protein